ncbi:hydrogenase iron-sulfur subunit [candidate division KSB1 bacterium]|nr:hydrogenase iron-sulfur subunit [candidate division KSB1 bacterium]
MAEEFEPKIVGFFCNWCTANAADLAGTTRLQYPPNLRPIRMMCSGTLDPTYVLSALLKGADSVLIGGCQPGDCHYVNGNYKARRRVAVLNTILKTFELGADRVWLRWIAASEGPKFAKTMNEFTEHTKKLGKNPLSDYWNV